MPTTNQKMLAFEYFIDRFIEWHNEISGTKGIPSDFTILKLIKLNFFAVAVTASPTNEGLLVLFDNFHALPMGHVESEVYSSKNLLNKYSFNGRQLSPKPSHETNYSEIEKYKELLDKAIVSLKHENEMLVMLSPLTLVDISHRWHSWIYSYKKARIEGKKSMKINPLLIQQDIKFFTL